MLNTPKISIEFPQPHFVPLQRGSEFTEDTITIGQIIAIWLVAIVSITIFVTASINSAENIVQPIEPDPVVQSDLCLQERLLDPVVFEPYVRIAETDPLPLEEHCYVRFF